VRKTIFPAILFCLLLSAGNRGFAQDSGVFLKLPLSPKAGAAGDAFAALADDPLGLSYNPAGIAFLQRPVVSFVYHQYLQDISGNSLGLVYPFHNFSIGIAPTIFKMEEEPIYDSQGIDTGRKFGYGAKIFPVAVAGRIGNLAVGVAGKSYSEDISGQKSATTAYDFGAIYKLYRLSFGAGILNLGGKIYGYEVAQVRRAGAAYTGGGFSAAVDLKKEGEDKSSLGLGGTLALAKVLKLRGGWRFKNDFGGLTFGLGVEFWTFSFDYAYLSYGDLGATHKAGVSLAFGGRNPEPGKPKQAAAPVPVPMGPKSGAGKMPGGTNVAVAEFIGKNVSQADASIVTDFLRTEMVNTGSFNVMDRNNMDALLAEQKFQSGGCTEQECAVQMGKLLNVRQMAVGSLSKLLGKYYLTVNMVDVETGKIIASYDQEALSDRDLKNSCQALATELTTPKDAAYGAPSGQGAAPAPARAAQTREKFNVAVAEFVAKNVSQADASIVADFLRTEMVKTGAFNVMDRNNMDTVLAEQKFQNSGCTEQECALEMGKLLNVRRMLVGSLSKLVDAYYVTVNVIDVETGKIIESYQTQASSSSELRNACRELANKIAR